MSLTASCESPFVLEASVKNQGLATLPAGVVVGYYLIGPPETKLGELKTTQPLAPGQTQKLPLTLPSGVGSTTSVYQARILLDPLNPTFHECKEDNNVSAKVTPACVKP